MASRAPHSSADALPALGTEKQGATGGPSSQPLLPCATLAVVTLEVLGPSAVGCQQLGHLGGSWAQGTRALKQASPSKTWSLHGQGGPVTRSPKLPALARHHHWPPAPRRSSHTPPQSSYLRNKQREGRTPQGSDRILAMRRQPDDRPRARGAHEETTPRAAQRKLGSPGRWVVKDGGGLCFHPRRPGPHSSLENPSCCHAFRPGSRAGPGFLPALLHLRRTVTPSVMVVTTTPGPVPRPWRHCDQPHNLRSLMMSQCREQSWDTLQPGLPQQHAQLCWEARAESSLQTLASPPRCLKPDTTAARRGRPVAETQGHGGSCAGTHLWTSPWGRPAWHCPRGRWAGWTGRRSRSQPP